MKQINNYLVIAIVSLMAACSTQKKIVTPPEGIEFTKVENFKGFTLINLPYSGNGFVKNTSVSVPKNQTDAGVFVPGVKYENNQLMIWSNIDNTEGEIEAQYEVINKRFLRHVTQENSEVTYENKKIGNKNVAFIKITTPKKSGILSYTYGYIIPHDNKAALFLIYDAMVYPDQLSKYDTYIGQALEYMVKTVEFQ